MISTEQPTRSSEQINQNVFKSRTRPPGSAWLNKVKSEAQEVDEDMRTQSEDRMSDVQVSRNCIFVHAISPIPNQILCSKSASTITNSSIESAASSAMNRNQNASGVRYQDENAMDMPGRRVQNLVYHDEVVRA